MDTKPKIISALETELIASIKEDREPNPLALGLLKCAIDQGDSDILNVVEPIDSKEVWTSGRFSRICCERENGAISQEIKVTCVKNKGKVLPDSECGIIRSPRTGRIGGGSSGGGGSLRDICNQVPCTVKFVGAEGEEPMPYCDIADQIEIAEISILAKSKTTK